MIPSLKNNSSKHTHDQSITHRIKTDTSIEQAKESYLAIWGQYPLSTYRLSFRYIPIKHQTIKQLSCGQNYCIFMTELGNIYGFGKNAYFSFTPEEDEEVIPTRIEVKSEFKIEGICCGYSHAIFWNDKEIFGCGESKKGAIGYEQEYKQNTRKIPLLITSGQRIEQVSCGNNITIVKIEQDFYGFGDNTHGQLGLPLKTYISEPEIIKVTNEGKLVKNIKTIKCGNQFTIAMDGEGKLYGNGIIPGINITKAEGLFPLNLQCTNYECKNELYLLKKDKLIIYGSFHGRNKRELPLSPSTTTKMKIGKDYGYILDDQVYSWGYSDDKTLRNKKEYFGKVSILNTELLDCCESWTVSVGSWEMCDRIGNFYKQSYIQVQYPHLIQEDKISSQKQQKQKKIFSLEKQVRQQKQVINLFEEYVSKLEKQNRNLKQLVSMSREDDEMGRQFKQLKEIITKMME